MVQELGKGLTQHEYEKVLSRAERILSPVPEDQDTFSQKDKVRRLGSEDLQPSGLSGLVKSKGDEELAAYILCLYAPSHELLDGWTETYLFIPMLHLILEIDSNLWASEGAIGLVDQDMANRRRFNRRNRVNASKINT